MGCHCAHFGDHPLSATMEAKACMRMSVVNHYRVLLSTCNSGSLTTKILVVWWHFNPMHPCPKFDEIHGINN